MVVYPDGIWYSGLTPEDVPEIVSEHFQHHRPVARLTNHDVAALRVEIETNKAKMLKGLADREKAGVLPDDLQQMIAGFRESRVLLTAIELDVLDARAGILSCSNVKTVRKGFLTAQHMSRLKQS
jgi:hypothetical protein